MNKSIRGFFADIETVPAILQSSYYPSLDGLRAVAIIMVVLSHLNNTDRFFYNNIFNGHLGVIIFFVLSGFLITTLCIKEKVITKSISLKNFYLRRALRIFPVAYLFVLVIIILNYFFKLGIGWLNILGTSLYLMNFSSYFRKYDYSWHTGHFWSLSVEEQFYLVIPFILKKRFKVYLSVLLSIVFIMPVFIILEYHFLVLNNIVFYALTHYLVKFLPIAVGCLLSVLTFKYSFTSNIIAKTKVPANILAIFLILFIHYDDFFSVENLLKGLACSMLTGYIIVSNIAPAKDLIFKILNTKLLKTIGVLSYSIYIWQEIFTSNDKRLPWFMVTYPYNIVCMVIVSCLSYYFYERFFLKLKTRFSKIKSKPVAVAA